MYTAPQNTLLPRRPTVPGGRRQKTEGGEQQVGVRRIPQHLVFCFDRMRVMGELDTEIEAQLMNVGLHVRLGSGIIKRARPRDQL